MVPPQFNRRENVPSPRVVYGVNSPPYSNVDRFIDTIKTPDGGGGGSAISFPFQIRSIDAGTAVINVRYGTLQDEEPTDIATDQDVDDGTNYIYLHLEVDIDGNYVSSELVIDLAPQPADDDYNGYITLGNVVVVDDEVVTINQAATHSLRFSVCGRVVEDGILITPGTFEFWGF